MLKKCKEDFLWSLFTDIDRNNDKKSQWKYWNSKFIQNTHEKYF